MEKQRQSLSTKKPPIPSAKHKVIEDWMSTRIMPGILPIIREIDRLIHDSIPKLKYSIKWGNAFYGTEKQGWLIEVAAYDISANIVFLNGASFNPTPPLGTDEKTRYVKVKSLTELEGPDIVSFMEQAGQSQGWK